VVTWAAKQLPSVANEFIHEVRSTDLVSMKAIAPNLPHVESKTAARLWYERPGAMYKYWRALRTRECVWWIALSGKCKQLLKLDGTLALVGAPEKPLPVAAFNLLLPRRNFAGSAIGGIAETQEMLDFCAAHGITSDIEMIPIQKINEAWERMLKQDVKYRFVIDMATLKSEAAA